MVRAPCCEKMGLKRGPWTPEEDQILISFIQKNGHGNWRALPKQAGLLRCGKSCRLRWINYLRPDIKRGNFSKEEEETIFQLHEMLGNRWSAIAARLPGRTDNEIKNVWHTHLKKKLKDYQPSKEAKMQSKSTIERNETVKTNFTAQQDFNSPGPLAAVSSPPHSSSELSSVTVEPSAMATIIPIKQGKFDAQEFLEGEDKGFVIKEEADFPFPLFPLDCDEEAVNAYPSRLDEGMEFWYDLYIQAGDLPDLLEL